MGRRFAICRGNVATRLPNRHPFYTIAGLVRAILQHPTDFFQALSN